MRNPAPADRRAVALMTDAMHETASRAVRLGLNPDAARAQVLDELTPAWGEHAGRDVARRAHDALLTMDAGSFLGAAQRRAHAEGMARLDAPVLAQAARWRAECDERERRCLGGTERERASRAAREVVVGLGLAVAVLVAALAVLLVVSGTAHAGEDPGKARWRALAECGVVSMSDPRYEARCRRFSRTEVDVTRPYDGPGAGAPREWEMPRPWE